jgi:hypothetical protein
VLDASYVGNQGTNIQTTRNINTTPLEHLSTSPVRDQARIDYLSALVPNPFVGLMPTTAPAAFRGATIARERLLRPYPHFDAVNTTTNEGRSWYHALQAGLQRRLSSGFTLGANYTLSRFTEATDFLNPPDPEPWKGISSQDAPHRLTVNGILEIPFGRERRFGRDMHPALDMVVGGWQVQGIYTYQTGFPLGFGNLLFTGDLDDIAISGSEQSVARWFNTAAGFNTLAAQQLASNVRTFPLRLDSVRGDNVSNLDMSVIKNAGLGGRKSLQLRIEAINALNHPLFPAANTTPTAGAFGSISASTQNNYARRGQVTIKFLF